MATVQERTTTPPVPLPVLQPVPITTKGLPWWKALHVWWSTQRHWDLVEDYWITLSDGTVVLIPKGFRFNGATVPRPLRWFISPTGVFLIPSLLHDFAYTYNYQLHAQSLGDWASVEAFPAKDSAKDYRDLWDVQFYQTSVQVSGMAWLAGTVYATLRAFGGKAWQEGRREAPPEMTLPEK